MSRAGGCVVKNPHLQWFASGGGISKTGPFPNEWSARLAFKLTVDAQERQRRERGTCSPYPFDLVIWPVPRGKGGA